MKKDVYNLSKPQEAIWLTEQYFKDTNINVIFSIGDFSKQNDNINFELFKKALNHMIKSNDNFQTRLFLENGTVKQYFCDFEEIDFPTFEVDSIDDFVKDNTSRNNIFDILNGPLYEFKIFKIKGTNTGGVLGIFHHIIADGITAALCIRQIADNYNALISNSEFPKIDTEELSYKKYLKSEKEYLNSEKFEKDKSYWNSVYETIPELATIRGNKNQKASLSCQAQRSTFVLDGTLMDKISSFCTENKISVYNFLMSIFGIYISKATRLDDFVIGTPILNRTNFKEKNTLGMYISTVPFRIKLEEDTTFEKFVSSIAKDSIAMLRHQRFSYQYILEELKKKDSSITKLYNIMLSYQITRAADSSSNYSADWFFNNCANDDLDIHIYDLNDENSVKISYDYNLDSHTKDEIESIHPRILKIIEQVLEKKDINIKDIDIITDEEKNLVLTKFNNTKTDYPSKKSVISIFEEQVSKHPNDNALFFDNKTLTYKELNEKANSLANFLKKTKNVKQNDVIGLILDKSFEEIIAMLAILKLGASYMPIDTSYPKDRISYMIENANAKFVLTTSDLESSAIQDSIKVFIDLDSNIYKESNIFKSKTSSNIASIMYTSGSTGTPKGVMITHIGIIRLVKNTNYIKFSKGDRILQAGSIAFDASTFEIWGALLNGLELFLIKKTDLLNPEYFEKYIKTNKITSTLITTSLFNKFCEANPHMFSNLKYLVSGGEAASIKHINAAREANPNLILENLYGPTENTVVSSFFKVTETLKDFIPIGYPISNSTCYIVSKDGKLMPPYVAGELWVGGDRFSRSDM